jgi:ADP-ribose pyrophosphatase YjhB (NUDIX family)
VIVPIPAVNAAIFNSRGELLLTRRSKAVREPGKWVLPGGHVDPGEDWDTASRREVSEETGLKVTSHELMGLYSDPEVTVTAETLAGGFRGQFVVVVYRVTGFTGEVNPNDEVDDWGWFRLDNLPSPLLKSHPIRIQDAFSFNGKVFVR